MSLACRPGQAVLRDSAQPRRELERTRNRSDTGGDQGGDTHGRATGASGRGREDDQG